MSQQATAPTPTTPHLQSKCSEVILPNLTRQIVIVILLELARVVENAFGKILGSSNPLLCM